VRFGGHAAVSLALIAAAAAPVATASEPLADKNVKLISFAVNTKGEALITYARGTAIRRVLVWGAINALTPSPTVPQVRFKYDYAGGWGKYRKQYWKTFKNACRKYDGPELAYAIATCKAPDGTYWALQSWQRNLPLLGFEAFKPDQDDWELHVAHWSGPLADLEVHTNWTYGGDAEGLFGRLTYLGQAVHGFGSTAVGNPKDRYGRNVYIDTFNSAYGPGWKRESGILVHRPTGTFCHSFVPQKVFTGYPNAGSTRPAAPGDRYRVTVMGPGVTPVMQWEGQGLKKYDADRDKEINETFDNIMEGDVICAGEK
jgi:hypothetical protein